MARTGAGLVRANALAIPLADESVDLIVTSPPYFALRSYRDGGEHFDGQIGSEATPQAFLEALWAVTAECARVLKPSGSLFVNLGDKYSGSGGPGGDYNKGGLRDGQPRIDAQSYWSRMAPANSGIPAKSLMLLPERYRIGCVDQLGLIARAVIVWNKPNGLPESVTDRVRRSHEDWVHLTKLPRYFSAVDEVREPCVYPDDNRHERGPRIRYDGAEPTGNTSNSNPLGKLPGSVWTVTTEPLSVPDHLGVDHFAAFPQEWPRRLILGWSPSGICTACGEGRRPVPNVRQEPTGHTRRTTSGLAEQEPIHHPGGFQRAGYESTRSVVSIDGYACACTPFTDHARNGSRDHDQERRGSGKKGWHADDHGPTPRIGPWREYHLEGWVPPPTRPAVVFDPFVGTGTVPMVARVLGRFGVGLDLSADYLRLARWRVWESGHAAKSRERSNTEAQGRMV